jgi:hypothetical protein
MGKFGTSLTAALMFQPGPPHSFVWGHLKFFGEAVVATQGKSFEFVFKEFQNYAPDKILLYQHALPV